MKKYFFIIASVFYMATAGAQVVLPVAVTYQEHDQWCWAGCTACILHYYGVSVNQCDIANYTRTVATWHNYGTTPCCVDPTMGCNYPNNNYGAAGSMQDILEHFDGLTNDGMGALSLAQMDSASAHYIPIIIFWQWTGGGGHFIVGNGVDTANNVHYMNPWPGEGAHICTHTWMLYDGSHNYLGTNVIEHCPIPVDAGTITGLSTVATGAHITLADTLSGGTWHCSNAHATVSATGVVTGITAGWDTVMYTVTNACGIATAKWPVHITTAISGVDDLASSKALDVYPNPNTGAFTVRLNTLRDEPVHIVVTNAAGIRIAELDTIANNAIPVTIDQPSGIYLITATTSQGTYVSKVTVSR